MNEIDQILDEAKTVVDKWNVGYSAHRDVVDLVHRFAKLLRQLRGDAQALHSWAIGDGRPSDDEVAQIELRLGL